MKSSAVVFCVIALSGLGQSQKCTTDTAFDLQDLIGNLGTSTGDSSQINDQGTSSLADTAGDTTTDFTIDTLQNEQDLNNQLNAAIVQGGESIKDITARSLLSRSLLNKRADFTCTDTETCFTVDGDLYCGDLESGDIRNTEGISGNVYTGDFSLPNGESGNLATVSFPLIPSVTLDPIVPSASTKATTAKNASPTTTNEKQASSTSASSAATATATDTPSPADASASVTSKASVFSSALSSVLQSRSEASSSAAASGSAASASSTAGAGPGNAASSLELSTPAMMSFIAAASLLWRIFLA